MWSNHPADRSVGKRVSQTQRASVSQIQLVEHRWGLGSQTQLDGFSETRPVGPRCHQPGRAVSQSAVVRRTDHTASVRQAPTESAFSQTQPDRRIIRQ